MYPGMRCPAGGDDVSAAVLPFRTREHHVSDTAVAKPDQQHRTWKFSEEGIHG